MLLVELPKTTNEELLITWFLHQLGLRTKNQGFHFLREAVLLVMEDPNKLDSLTDLYNEIAIKFGSSYSRVERNLRYSVETAWLRADPEVSELFFGYSVDSEKGRPHVAEVIFGIADYVRIMKKGI